MHARSLYISRKVYWVKRDYPKIAYCIISVIKYFWNGGQINGTRIRVMGEEGERKDATVIIKGHRMDTYNDGTVHIVDCVSRYKNLHV